MIKEAIGILIKGQALTLDEATRVMEEIMEGRATPAQMGAFLTALNIKGESSEEIAGLAKVMREKAIPVMIDEPVLDIVGTGGDGLNTFNISTTAALITAGAGLKVAKHGNRAATSRCGSADVLEKLGVKIDLTAAHVQKCIQEAGIGFMFAPAFHPAMKYAAGPRSEIGIRSIFNILGPLTNPARAEYQVIGVPSIEMAEKVIPTLAYLGSKHALVVHGLNGMDEIAISHESLVWEVKNGTLISRHRIYPELFGLTRSAPHSICGGSPDENAMTVMSILNGKKGAKRDVAVMNAAAALLAGNLVSTFTQGIQTAQEIIDSGKALEKLHRLIEFTNSCR